MIMKITKRGLWGLALIIISLSTLSAQTKRERREVKSKEVKELIEAEQYKIEIHTAYPQQGRAIQLSANYSVEIRNDSIFSYLPYYGRAYSIPYGGGEGLNFRAPLKEYKMKTDKKGSTRITLTTQSKEDRLEYRITIFPNGSASIDITMQQRQSIRFAGELLLPL